MCLRGSATAGQCAQILLSHGEGELPVNLSSSLIKPGNRLCHIVTTTDELKKCFMQQCVYQLVKYSYA